MNKQDLAQIQLVLKDNITDGVGKRVEESVSKYLGIETGKVKTAKIFTLLYDLEIDQLTAFAKKGLRDEIIHDVYINSFYHNDFYKSYIMVSKLPGVTDDEGISAQKALCDFFNLELETHQQQIFTQEIYFIENKLNNECLEKIAQDLLGNKLINHFEYGDFTGLVDYLPQVKMRADLTTESIDLSVGDEELKKLSDDRLLSLSLTEMKAIQEYYQRPDIKEKRKQAGLADLPTDCEIEVFAQTWSEHCKHKEFNALIEYKNEETGETKEINSLFKTFIKGSTDLIQKRILDKNEQSWLVKVFNDNAGVVRVNKDKLFIWKVETHNTPSALDPYGGALTGILGVNRDSYGTGRGGGRLLFNTNVLCFGSPFYDGKLLKGQLHPKRIFSGVRKGIEDGGNKSGIPTVNGAIIFDDRYRGKPLVYCGTGAIMPTHYQGLQSWDKEIAAGDLVISGGGRVGKDGIHGATFSSAEIDENSPQSAVQIGSPITQKLFFDFMEKACDQGLVKCSTDMGAGGLSSAIGEMAQISGGAVINLEKVPLKYSGLKPWEIFISESQERMTIVVEPKKKEDLFKLADEFEVELSEVGHFTDTGFLEIAYDQKTIAMLEMEFLHEGVPQKQMQAAWQKPKSTEPQLAEISDYNETLINLMGSENICSRENVIRQYDHEVKGKTIIKPLMGPYGQAPQDAAVMRVDFKTYQGIAVSNGILPRYGDLDAYQMSAGAFDEAVRQIIAVGGKLPDPECAGYNFWSVNDNFCVPDSAYHETNNPDGKYKLAQLVNMCQALYDQATFFNIPMTSGKDSMKNDFRGEDIKISVPPTILYSMVAKIEDVRKTVSSEFKKADDQIYLVGKTYDELGASEFYKMHNELGANVPKVRREDAKRIYQKMMQANSKGLIQSAHDISDGGLAVALVESAFGGEFGFNVSLIDKDMALNSQLFSESHSRFVVSVKPKERDEFTEIFGNDCQYLGEVTAGKKAVLKWHKGTVINLEIEKLHQAWKQGLEF